MIDTQMLMVIQRIVNVLAALQVSFVDQTTAETASQPMFAVKHFGLARFHLASLDMKKFSRMMTH